MDTSHALDPSNKETGEIVLQIGQQHLYMTEIMLVRMLTQPASQTFPGYMLIKDLVRISLSYVPLPEVVGDITVLCVDPL